MATSGLCAGLCSSKLFQLNSHLIIKAERGRCVLLGRFYFDIVVLELRESVSLFCCCKDEAEMESGSSIYCP